MCWPQRRCRNDPDTRSAPVSAQVHAKGRFGSVLGTTLSGRSLLLLLAGILFAIPGFFGLRWLALMLAWDAMVVVLLVVDILSLPPAHSFRVTRSFLDSPVLGRETRIEVAVEHLSHVVIRVSVADDLHPALAMTPPVGTDRRLSSRSGAHRVRRDAQPARRFRARTARPRWNGRLRLAQRRALCEPAQRSASIRPWSAPPTIRHCICYVFARSICSAAACG